MSEVLLGFVGDVLVDRARPAEIFGEVREILSVPDILFANLEGAYTDTPRPVPSMLSPVSAPAHNLDVYAEAGFDVMSLANNHILDAGHEAMLENRSRLQTQGVQTCGVGPSLKEAREPAILQAKGLRVAFLAYASVFPKGYEARTDMPGLVPMRAYNFWRDPYPNLYTPGKHPLAVTIPDEFDLAGLTDDIRRAREHADIVVVSFHWGDTSYAFRLTDHETRTAKYCIDQGAHMVVGHHHHALRGMEWYNSRPIMYGLGHFVFDLRIKWSEQEFKTHLADWDPSGYSSQIEYKPGPRKGWPLLPMHEDTRMTALAWATATSEGVNAIGLLPCRLTADGLVHPLRLDSPEGKEVIAYFDKCNKTQNLKSRLTQEGAVTLAGWQTLQIVPA